MITSSLPISALIVAGGKGTRLLPLTQATPKPLLKINGRPILEWIIELLFLHNINDISVSINHLAETIINFIESNSRYSKINILRENTPLDDIGILGVCNKTIFHNKTILVINADLFTNINLTDFHSSFLNCKADMTIATFIYKNVIPYGIVSSENNFITRLDEKPILEMEINGGIYLFKKELLDLIPSNRPYKAWEFINLLLENQYYKISTFLINDIWIDIGSIESYEKAEMIAQNNQFILNQSYHNY